MLGTGALAVANSWGERPTDSVSAAGKAVDSQHRVVVVREQRHCRGLPARTPDACRHGDTVRSGRNGISAGTSSTIVNARVAARVNTSRNTTVSRMRLCSCSPARCTSAPES